MKMRKKFNYLTFLIFCLKKFDFENCEVPHSGIIISNDNPIMIYDVTKNDPPIYVHYKFAS